MSDEPKFVLSLIVPVFNEEDNLPALVERVKAVVEAEGVDYEFMFIDDGSKDRSLDVLTELAAADERVKIVSLSRNFGSHAAISAGIDHVSGDAAVIMAADLQDPPEVIGEFLKKMREGYDVVWGARAARPESMRRRLAGRVFYGLVRSIALPGYPKGGTGSFCLITRRVVEALRLFPEKQRITFGLVYWAGFKQTLVLYERAPRRAGSSGWSRRRLIDASIDVLTTYSYAPLRAITYLGLVVFLLSLIGIGYVIVNWLLTEETLAGWSSTFVAIAFFGGLQMITLGVVGEYLWRIAVEVRRRPLYIAAKKINLPD